MISFVASEARQYPWHSWRESISQRLRGQPVSHLQKSRTARKSAVSSCDLSDNPAQSIERIAIESAVLRLQTQTSCHSPGAANQQLPHSDEHQILTCAARFNCRASRHAPGEVARQEEQGSTSSVFLGHQLVDQQANA